MENIDKEFEEKLDAAILAGADIGDLNSILSRSGRDTFQEINPLEVDQAEVENPLETVLENKNEFSKTDSAVRGAAVAIGRGKDPVEFFQSMVNYDPEIISQDMIESSKKMGRDAVISAVEQLAFEEGEVDIEAVSEVLQAQEEELSDPVFGKHRAYAMQLEGAENLDPEVIDNIAANSAISEMISQTWDEMSIGQTLSDVVGLVAIPDTAYNSTEVLKEFFPNSSFIENYWTSADAVIKVRNMARALPPKQRVKLASKIQELYKEVDDNQLQNMFLMFDLFDTDEDGLFGTRETDIKVDQFLDKASVAALGTGLLLRLNRLRKMGNVLKQAAEAQNAEVAGQVSYVASQSEEVRAAVGIDKIDAVAGADPHTAITKQLLDGVPEDYAVVINQKWKNIDDRLAEATRVDDFNLPLTEQEKIAKAKLVQSRLEKYSGIQDVSYRINPDGVLVDFNVVDQVTGKVVGKNKEPLSIPFTINDITGGFESKGLTFVGEIGKAVVSPNFLFNKDRNFLLQTMERIGFASDKIKGQLNETLLSATSKLDKDQLKNVQNLLRKGDSEGDVFSYNKIVNEMGLSEKEFEAYSSTRRIIDQAFLLKNKEVRSRMVAQGIKDIKVGESSVAGRPYDTVQEASTAYMNNAGAIIVEDTGDVITDGAQLGEFYKNNYMLAGTRKSDDFFEVSGNNYQWTLVPRVNIRELPVNVIDKKTGYIPRAYRNATFFVKREDIVEIDGGTRTAKKLNTLRYFDNPSDAEKYIDLLAEEAKVTNTPFDRNQYRVLGDREIPSEILDEDYINAYGGLYTSSRRTQGPLEFGLPGQKAELVDVYETLQNYFSNIGNRLPLSEYRVGIQQRWLNHARHMNLLPKEYSGNFTEAVGALRLTGQDPRSLSFLEKAHDQIQHMSRIPSVEEQKWAGLVKEVGKSIEARGGRGLAKHVYNMQQKTPIDALRSGTFHLLLGSFNLSQLLVQSFGATVALSINPKSAVKALPRALAYRSLDQIRDPSMRLRAAKKLEASVGKGFAREYDLWSKSGLYETVVKSNSDYQALASGMPVDAGLLRRLWDKNTLFYKEGELVNSRISFATAVERWKGLNKGKELTEDVLSELVTRTEQYRLNMSNANKATVQKNWLRLFTQFQAVNARYLEAFGANTFTRQEKARLFFGQTTLFGAASVPFFESNMGSFVESLGISPESMSREEIVAFRQGFVGHMFANVLGVESDVGGRVALGNDFLEGIIENVTTPKSAISILFGPSWTTLDRGMDVVNSLQHAVSGLESAEGIDKQTILFAAETVGSTLLDLPSSTRNLIKAHYMTNSSLFRNKSGQPIFMEDQNFQTELALALGFQPQDLVDFYDIKQLKRGRQQSIKHYADSITDIYHKIATGDPSDREAYVFAARSVLSSVESQKDRIDIMNKVENSLRKGRGAKSREIMEVLKNINSDFVGNTAKFIPSVQEKLQQGEQR